MPVAGRLLAAAALVLAAAAGGGAAAQPAVPAALPFLIVNQEEILTRSQAGRALLDEEEQRRDALRTEARGLESAFEAEERQLTERRPTLSPEEFRKLSDAFDARVVDARRGQDERAAALAQEFDQRRRQFYARVAPVLVSLMDRFGAKAILDESVVLVADQTLNITDAIIAEIDEQSAAQPAPVPKDDPAAPATPAAPAPGTTEGEE